MGLGLGLGFGPGFGFGSGFGFVFGFVFGFGLEPAALALRPAVLEGGVDHVRVGVHEVRHARDEEGVAGGEERHGEHSCA